MTKAKANPGKMAGKSDAKVKRTAATEKALAGKPISTDPTAVAATVLASLRAGKLDKHGVRLETALQKIVDGGDSANLPDLAKQVDDYIAKGVPEETKSTRRRAKPDPKVELTAEDKGQIADEAQHRKAGTIEHVKNTQDGSYVAVGKVGGDSFVLPRALETKEFQELAQVGKPYLPAKKLADDLIAKRAAVPGHLARGLDARNSPQSVAAHQAKKQAAGKGQPDPKPTPAKQTATAKKAERKAERAEKAAPKGDDKRAITILKKDFAFGREGSARRASWDKALKAKTVAAYIASGGAAKYLPRWVSAGAIKMA